MIKYVVIATLMVVIGAYVVTVLCSNGMKQIEDVAAINKKAEDRMNLIDKMMKNDLGENVNIIHDDIDGKINYIVESNSIVIGNGGIKTSNTVIHIGDSETSIYEKLGAPDKTEYIKNYKYVKYPSVKFAVINNKIIGISR